MSSPDSLTFEELMRRPPSPKNNIISWEEVQRPLPPVVKSARRKTRENWTFGEALDASGLNSTRSLFSNARNPYFVSPNLPDMSLRKDAELVGFIEGMIRLYLESAVAESEVVDNAFYLLIGNMDQLFLQFSKLQMVKDEFLAFLPDTRFLPCLKAHSRTSWCSPRSTRVHNVVRTWVWADEERALVTRSLALALRVSCPSLKPGTWKHLGHNATSLEELVVADNDAEADDRSTSNPLERQYIGLMNILASGDTGAARHTLQTTSQGRLASLRAEFGRQRFRALAERIFTGALDCGDRGWAFDDAPCKTRATATKPDGDSHDGGSVLEDE